MSCNETQQMAATELRDFANALFWLLSVATIQQYRIQLVARKKKFLSYVTRCKLSSIVFCNRWPLVQSCGLASLNTKMIYWKALFTWLHFLPQPLSLTMKPSIITFYCTLYTLFMVQYSKGGKLNTNRRETAGRFIYWNRASVFIAKCPVFCVIYRDN